MRLFLLVATILLVGAPSENAYTQSRSLSLELGGSAGIASLNFEKAFREAANQQLSYRIGISGFPIDGNSGVALIFPLALQYRRGAGPHQAELAMGLNLSLTTRGKFFTQAIPAIGYRFQREEKRWFWKVSYTPLISFIFNWQYQHWAGLSIGYDL
ncbi:MAG: hypothetical protein AAFQ68_21435 [Bacteroidota bacterium]